MTEKIPPPWSRGTSSQLNASQIQPHQIKVYFKVQDIPQALIEGKNGFIFKSIHKDTGARCTLQGVGGEPGSLHILIEHTDIKSLQRAKRLAETMVTVMENSYTELCHKKEEQQKLQAQKSTVMPPANPTSETRDRDGPKDVGFKVFKSDEYELTLHKAQWCDDSSPDPSETTPSELWWNGSESSDDEYKQLSPRSANLATSSTITSAQGHNQKSLDQSQEHKDVKSSLHTRRLAESDLSLRKPRGNHLKTNKRWRIFNDDGSFICTRSHQLLKRGLQHQDQSRMKSTPHTAEGCSQPSRASVVTTGPGETREEFGSESVRHRYVHKRHEPVNLHFPSEQPAQRQELKRVDALALFDLPNSLTNSSLDRRDLPTCSSGKEDSISMFTSAHFQDKLAQRQDYKRVEPHESFGFSRRMSDYAFDSKNLPRSHYSEPVESFSFNTPAEVENYYYSDREEALARERSYRNEIENYYYSDREQVLARERSYRNEIENYYYSDREQERSYRNEIENYYYSDREQILARERSYRSKLENYYYPDRKEVLARERSYRNELENYYYSNREEGLAWEQSYRRVESQDSTNYSRSLTDFPLENRDLPSRYYESAEPISFTTSAPTSHYHDEDADQRQSGQRFEPKHSYEYSQNFEPRNNLVPAKQTSMINYPQISHFVDADEELAKVQDCQMSKESKVERKDLQSLNLALIPGRLLHRLASTCRNMTTTEIRNRKWRIRLDDGSYIRVRPHQLQRLLEDRNQSQLTSTTETANKQSQEQCQSSTATSRQSQLTSTTETANKQSQEQSSTATSRQSQLTSTTETANKQSQEQCQTSTSTSRQSQLTSTTETANKQSQEQCQSSTATSRPSQRFEESYEEEVKQEHFLQGSATSTLISADGLSRESAPKQEHQMVKPRESSGNGLRPTADLSKRKLEELKKLAPSHVRKLVAQYQNMSSREKKNKRCRIFLNDGSYVRLRPHQLANLFHS